jgi:hypothetical protein
MARMASSSAAAWVVVAVALSWACEHAELPTCEGSENCDCRPNGTCNSGLVCDDGECVQSSSQGGASGVGGSDSGGAGATTSTGGSATGGGSGATGTGGDGGTGAMGGTGSGGDAGTNSTGGTGSGGDAGTNSTGGTDATGGTGSGGTSGSAGSGGGGAGSGGGGANRITNGDFSNGENDWNTNGASANHSVMNGVWCAQALTTDAHVVLGWPQSESQAIALSGEYTFSFKMSLSGNATIIAKVGQAVSPYTSDFESRPMPTGTLETFTYTSTTNDPQAGVAFDITGHSPPTTVCIDDVVLAPR